MKKSLKTAVLYIWQAPQVLLGYAMLLVMKIFHKSVVHFGTDPNGVQLWRSDGMRGAISLGMLTIHSNWNMGPADIRHELGHTKQSRILGPFYLIIIGIPSLLHAAFWKPDKGDYYAYWTEKWADKLGGIKRRIKRMTENA